MSLNSNYSSNEHEKLSWLYENTLNERRFRTSEVLAASCKTVAVAMRGAKRV